MALWLVEPVPECTVDIEETEEIAEVLGQALVSRA